MTITLQKAKSLCNKSEFELVHWSTKGRVQNLTPSRLKEKITRARKLRDKFRGLAHSQQRESRGKQDARRARPAAGNERTKEKAQLFQETLDRFEQALSERTETQATSASKSKDKKKKSARTSAKKTETTSKMNKKTTGKKSTRKKAGDTSAAKAPAKESSGRSAKPASARSGAKAGGKLKSPSAAATILNPSAGGAHSTTSIEGRQVRRKESSKQSIFKRQESRFSRTSQEKIQGHVSGQTRRNQAKRDSKG